MNASSCTNLSKQLIFATIAGSSLIASANCEYYNTPEPSIVANYSNLTPTYPWDCNIQNDLLSPEELQYETVMAFASKLITESIDIDEDIQAAVNKIFWDLL
ncbi:hypothetical protein SDC9_190016 [bioreactor metagenome]|uniref:Uncharacterized protein n=1 Tax=bioreactor metagenome TaxID=1076179 RepID=A0A645HW86_9ZZZZ